MPVRSYEAVAATGPGTLILVSRAELAIAQKAIEDPLFADVMRSEASRGQEPFVMAHALATFAHCAKLPEWGRTGDGRSAPTGNVLSGGDAIARLIATFGVRNLTRRIWIDTTAKPIKEDGHGPFPSGLLRDAVAISQRRHVQKDLRRARIDAESFAPPGRDALAARQ